MPLLGIQPANLLQSVLDNVGIAVAVLDREEMLVFANRTASSMFGRAGDYQPSPFREWCKKYRFEDTHGKEILPSDSAVLRAMASDKLEQQDLCVRLPDGGRRWLRTWAHPFSAMGLTGVLAIISDQTVEIELQRTTEQLKRMETLATLAATLVHDFNNVLTVISSNVGLALSDSGLGDATRNRLEQTEAASEKAAGLVKRLMEFSGTQTLDFKPVQINDVVGDVLRLAYPLFPPDITVVTNMHDDLPHIQADRAHLERALLNLIVNARDAMNTGGKLAISTSIQSRTPRIAGKDSPQFVVISVADTGTGIAPCIQSNVFEPFFTTKASASGTGLGLSSTYGIVRSHNGTIELDSTSGEGTTFRILLPVQAMIDRGVR